MAPQFDAEQRGGSVGDPRPIATPRSAMNEEVRRSLLILDLAAQRARVMSAEVEDLKVREILLGHVDAVDALLRHARKLAWRI